MAEMAHLGAGVYALSGIASVLSGWASDQWLRAGASANRVRKTALLAGFAGIAVCMSAGITAPAVTGVVVDRTGAFSLGFVIAAVLAVIGILAYGLVVRRIEPIDWSAADSVVLASAPPY